MALWDLSRCVLSYRTYHRGEGCLCRGIEVSPDRCSWSIILMGRVLPKELLRVDPTSSVYCVSFCIPAMRWTTMPEPWRGGCDFVMICQERLNMGLHGLWRAVDTPVDRVDVDEKTRMLWSSSWMMMIKVYKAMKRCIGWNDKPKYSNH